MVVEQRPLDIGAGIGKWPFAISRSLVRRNYRTHFFNFFLLFRFASFLTLAQETISSGEISIQDATNRKRVIIQSQKTTVFTLWQYWRRTLIIRLACFGVFFKQVTLDTNARFQRHDRSIRAMDRLAIGDFAQSSDEVIFRQWRVWLDITALAYHPPKNLLASWPLFCLMGGKKFAHVPSKTLENIFW